MLRNTFLMIATSFGLAAPVFAGEDPVVIELYTSQGCSSCPPADAYLHELAKRDDVIALAMHVDYWDYIGWKDDFADPYHAVRQRGYARNAGQRLIYTPQMVINGQEDVVGNRPKDVEAVIKRHKQQPDYIRLDVSRSGNDLTIDAEALQTLEALVAVQVITYNPSATVEIHRGENAGRTLDYVNVVTSITPLGEWDSAEPLSVTVPVEDGPMAIVMQYDQGVGKVLAAAKVN